jgi:hypothetical protein
MPQETCALSALLPLEKDRLYAIDNSVNGCSEPILTKLRMSLLGQIDGCTKGIHDPIRTSVLLIQRLANSDQQFR